MTPEVYNISLSSIEVTQIRVVISSFIKQCRERYYSCVGKPELSDIADYWLAEIREYEKLMTRFQTIKPFGEEQNHGK